MLLATILLITAVGCSNNKSITEIESTYENGSKKVVRTYAEIGEEKVLLEEKSFYPTGELKMVGKFQDEMRDGDWISYYKNGNVWAKAQYVNGKEQGLKTIYYENGNIYYVGTMISGKRVGKWKFYDVKGQETIIDYDKKAL